MTKPDTQRRYIKRLFSSADLRNLFDIPQDELITDFCFDRNENRYTLTTLKDYDKKEGDI